MKQKIYLTIILVLTVFTLMSCDSFWKHSYEKPVTISFKIPQELIQSVRAEASESLRSVQGGRNIESVDPTITARASIHNAQDNAILTEKTIPLGDNLDDTVTFEGLYIVGKTVYVQIELSQLGYVTRVKKSQSLTVVEGLNKIELDFDDAELATYSITYNLDGGENFENAPAAYTMVTPTILLGTPVKVGYSFEGWYDNATFEGEIITEITQGSIGNITLYAKWTKMVSFYVSSSGDDDNIGTQALPFASVQKAVDTIIEKNDGVTTYGIIIKGTISIEGENVDAGINDDDDGMVEIESDTKLNIMLQGFSEDEQGTIDASSLTPRKRVLYINGDSTTVTLADNIAITGGTYSDSAHNGGGVYIGNATFNMISETAKIENNSGKSGGGVYLDAGIFNLSAGTISGNTCAEGAGFGGGGIYIAHGQGGKLNLSGKPIVTSNGITDDNTGIKDNVNFANDKNESPVKITGDITSGASIGMSPSSKIGGFMLVQNTATHDFEASYFSMDDDTLFSQKVDKHLKISSSNAIYLSGSGNDTNSGTDIDNAVQSFDTALSRIGEGGTIWITSAVEVSSDQIWQKPDGWADSSKLTVKRYDNTTATDKSGTSFPGNLINVTGGTLTVQNITIDGMGGVDTDGDGTSDYDGTVDATAPLVNVTGGNLTLGSGAVLQNNDNTTTNGGAISFSGTTLTMGSGAIIRGNKASSSVIDTGSGGGIYLISGQLTMNDGSTINSNSSSNGGGVYINDFDTVNPDTVLFTMKDGATISSNSAKNGGGVYMNSHGTTTFNMAGGEIKGNTSTGTADDSGGGGVYVNSVDDGTTTFTMSGGTIGGDSVADKNTAGRNGGGVYVNKGTFTMNNASAKISNNTSNHPTDSSVDGGGGGVYVAAGTFEMVNGTISGNTALKNGGGVHIDDAAGTFTMSDGTIGGVDAGDENSALSGGGVYLRYGTFNLSGGSITGNKREPNGVIPYGGGGIYVNHDNLNQVLNLSGSPTVTGNTVGDTDTEDNLNFANTETTSPVKIVGALETNADIGLSPSNPGNGFVVVQAAAPAGSSIVYDPIQDTDLAKFSLDTPDPLKPLIIDGATIKIAPSIIRGAFTVIGPTGALNSLGYASSVLTINSNDLIVKNTDPSTSTRDRIVLGSAVSRVTLAGVNIQQPGDARAQYDALTLAESTTLTIEGSNTLKGNSGENDFGENGGHSISKNSSINISFNGSGTLTGIGGDGGSSSLPGGAGGDGGDGYGYGLGGNAQGGQGGNSFAGAGGAGGDAYGYEGANSIGGAGGAGGVGGGDGGDAYGYGSGTSTGGAGGTGSPNGANGEGIRG